MKARTSRRSGSTTRRTRSVAVDLTTRAAGARAVKGGIVIDWMPKAGADKPGQTQGVIAIIRPEGGAR